MSMNGSHAKMVICNWFITIFVALSGYSIEGIAPHLDRYLFESDIKLGENSRLLFLMLKIGQEEERARKNVCQTIEVFKELWKMN